MSIQSCEFMDNIKEKSKKWALVHYVASIAICRQCHNGIHKYYDEMTLAKRLFTLEAIKSDRHLANHFAWVAKQRISV